MMESNDTVIRRVTVDEKIGEELARFLVAGFQGDAESFLDGSGEWSEEEEITTSIEGLARVFGNEMKDIDWSELKEGQVFVVGPVESIGTEDDPEGFRMNRSLKPRCIRIDTLTRVKEESKQLYSKALRGEGDHHA